MVDLCKSKNLEPVVPPKKNHKYPWQYNHNVYAFRNEVERAFNKLKNMRRIATRYDKLDTSYLNFVNLGLIKMFLKVIC
jgi:transposase